MVDADLRNAAQVVLASPGDVRAVVELHRILMRLSWNKVSDFLRSFFVQDAFFILNHEFGYWFVNLPFQDGVVHVFWSKGFMGKKQPKKYSTTFNENPVRHTQDEWIKFFRRLGGGWELPDAPLYYATFRALFAARNDWQKEEVAGIRNTFQNHLKFNIVTSTRIVYGGIPDIYTLRQEQDVILHRIGTKEQYVGGEGQFVGYNRWICKSGASRILGELLGHHPIQEGVIYSILRTGDEGEVQTVCRWMNGRNPYLSLMTERPRTTLVKPVALGVAGLDRFEIKGEGNIFPYWPALGVVVIQVCKKSP